MKAQMKRLILILLPLGTLGISACDLLSGLGQASPEGVLENYLEATHAYDAATAYSKVTKDDQAAKTLAEFQAQLETLKASPFAPLRESIRFEIADVRLNGNSASALALITGPDLGVALSDIAGAGPGVAFGQTQATAKLEDAIAQKTDGGHLPETTKTKTFQLRKGTDGWRVFLDWKAEKLAYLERLEKEKAERERQAQEAKKAVEVQAKIDSLQHEAQEMYSEDNLQEAFSLYRQMLELDFYNTAAEKGLNEVNRRSAVIKYRRKIRLYDLQFGLYDTQQDGKIPGLSFKLRNDGDKTLTEVKVRASFLNRNGEVIARETLTPIRAGSTSANQSGTALKPDEEWAMEPGLFFHTRTVPPDWDASKLEAEISDLKFAD